jgi:RNA polymerase sigma-70 factor (ECF subfamily)
LSTGYSDIHKALVEKCRQGDSKAQYELYRLYASNMYNVSLRMVNHIGEAEDILQESFIEAFKNIKEFREDSTFGAWLKRIVVNRSINYLNKRKPELFENPLELEELICHEEEPEDYTLTVKKILNAIQQLPDGYRVVLNMYLFEGFDHSEIAQILKISESTSKSQFNRAKNRLRILLENTNYEKQY